MRESAARQNRLMPSWVPRLPYALLLAALAMAGMAGLSCGGSSPAEPLNGTLTPPVLASDVGANELLPSVAELPDEFEQVTSRCLSSLELTASGLGLTDHCARFYAGPGPRGRAYIRAAAYIFDDQSSAQSFFDGFDDETVVDTFASSVQGFRATSAGPFQAALIGEESRAWLLGLSGDEAAGVVDAHAIVFRLGSIVGKLSMEAAGGGLPDFAEVESLALRMAEKAKGVE